ncbi:MAG: periplasmic monoheme cytochrome [Pseudomonadota bacterium]|jgi:cytochrome c553
MKKLAIAMLLAGTTLVMANPAAKCAGCHGADGGKNTMDATRVPNKLSKADFETAMKGYADGSYGGAKKAMMKGFATNADIEGIATAWGLK